MQEIQLKRTGLLLCLMLRIIETEKPRSNYFQFIVKLKEKLTN